MDTYLASNAAYQDESRLEHWARYMWFRSWMLAAKWKHRTHESWWTSSGLAIELSRTHWLWYVDRLVAVWLLPSLRLWQVSHCRRNLSSMPLGCVSGQILGVHLVPLSASSCHCAVESWYLRVSCFRDRTYTDIVLRLRLLITCIFKGICPLGINRRPNFTESLKVCDLIAAAHAGL